MYQTALRENKLSLIPHPKSLSWLSGKTLLRVKFLSIFMLAACLHLCASGIAQQVTISTKNAPLTDVFSNIRKQTGYLFVYDLQMMGSAKKVNISVKNVSLIDALNLCFKDQPLTYIIEGNTVVIRKREKTDNSLNRVNIASLIMITGTVKDDLGAVLQGASITLLGTGKTVQTNSKGEFEIDVPDNKAVLRITMIGYEAQQIVVDKEISLNIILVKNLKALDEVVVVGYGTQKKADVTGSAARITTDKTSDLPNYNVMQSLQGRAAGLTVTSPDRPGESPQISIRGTNSISASTNPLIVLDGIIYNGSISDINANDISSVDILKDASAAAVYGSRAANGVLLITTKMGTTGKAQFNFNTYHGIQRPDNLVKVLDGPGYLQKVLDFREATGLEADPSKIDNYLTVVEAENHKNGNTTDWMDKVIQTAYMNNYHLDISGKSGGTNYYISGTHFKQDGIVVNDNYKRTTLNLNLTNQITDWYSITVKSMFSSQDLSGRQASLTNAYQQSPYGNFYDANGPGGYALLPVGDAVGVHPLANTLIKNKDTRTSLWGLFSSNLNVPFIPGLKWTLNFSSNLRNSKMNEYIDKESSTAGRTANGIGNKNIFESLDWTLDNILNYKRTFSKHSVDITFLYSRERNRIDSSGLSGSNFFTEATDYNNLNIAQVQQVGSNYEQQNSIAYMGRLNYGFDNRYAITFTARKDGFSGFAENNKYAVFPSVAFAWTITNEKFMEKIDLLNYLKLRVSYGRNGNQAVGRYQSLARMVSDQYLFDQQTVTSVYVNSMANDDLTWETTTTKNIGIDFIILDQRINGTVDAYSSNTTDILLRRALPQTSGFQEIFTNVGQVHNQGIEITFNSINIKNDLRKFRWETGLIFTLNRNRIDKLTGEDADKNGREDDDIRNEWFIGESLGSIYGYKTDGIYQQNEASIPSGFKPGDFRIVDVNKDGKLTPEDRLILGNRLPNYSFSISNTFRFGNFGFYVLVNSIQGGHNNSYVGNNYATRSPNAPFTSFTERFNIQDVPYWTPIRPSNDYPRINYNPTLPHPVLEDRSFIRLQDISLSYTFGKNVLDKIRLNNLRVYASAKNLYTHSKWTGYDPENASTLINFPLMRTYTIGIDFKF